MLVSDGADHLHTSSVIQLHSSLSNTHQNSFRGAKGQQQIGGFPGFGGWRLVAVGDEFREEEEGEVLMKSWGAFRQPVNSVNGSLRQTHSDCQTTQDMWGTSVDAIQLHRAAHTHTHQLSSLTPLSPRPFMTSEIMSL